MFCSACGAEVQEGLRYCNRCGANLAAESGAPPPRLFGILLMLLGAVVVVGVAGLAAIFFFSIEFMSRGNIPAETLVFLLVFTLVVFGIEAMLIRQLSRVLSVYLKSGDSAATENSKSSKTPPQQLQPQQPTRELTEQKQDYIPAQAAPHQTASPESEPTTRILHGEEPATRRLGDD
ncbi:MAG TPA: zinc ribbon domain-containing protein [Pyrinomonadaceae bacterium]|nr:zinc ribbon domain-containing protein [Pyrinomonadaceae bacterium]